TDQGVLAHLDARPIHEVRTPMLRDDSCLLEAVLGLLRHWVDEGALEADQVGPGEEQTWRGNALALHAPAPVHQVGHADQHLFRIAPAQLAGSPERTGIDDGYADR